MVRAEGGASQVLPLHKKGGAEIVFTVLKGGGGRGGTPSFGVVLAHAFEVLAMLKGGGGNKFWSNFNKGA